MGKLYCSLSLKEKYKKVKACKSSVFKVNEKLYVTSEKIKKYY